MVATGTRVELVKTRMMTGNSPASPAASGSRISRPSRTSTHDSAIPAATASASATATAAGPVWKRNPAAARPASTAPPGTGRDRNLAIIPAARSPAAATAVCEAPNPIASSTAPGNRKSM